MRNVIVLLLTLLILAVVGDTLFYWRNAPLGTVPVESRKMVYDIIIFILGIVSGYIGHNNNVK